MKKRFIACLTCMLFTLSLIAAPAFAATQDDLNAALQKIKDAQYQVDQTKTSIADIQKEIQNSQAAIETINGVITDLDGQIASTQQELDVAQAHQNELETALEERLRVMYMYGDEGYLEVLFSSSNFTELLTRIDQVRSVMQSDRNTVDEFQKTVDTIETKKNELDSAKNAQTEARASQEGIKAQQDQLLAQNQEVLAQQEAALAQEQAEGTEIAKALGMTSFNGIIQSGDYFWPIDPSNPNAFHISDWFGARSYGATNGVGSTNHQGVDIVPGNGEPILAIADGTVEIAASYGGYGNAVVIDHGVNSSGVKIGSISGHMSSIAVTQGQTVTKGQVIGYVGSTGNSTGPHLHLTITENGTMVDPMTYFPQYQNSCVFTG